MSRLARLRARRDRQRDRAKSATAKVKRYRRIGIRARAVARGLTRKIAAARKPKPSTEWGGSRAVTDEVIRIVGDRAAVTSRKRTAADPLSIANPGSDHSAQNEHADAVDFGVANAYALAREITSRLGAPGQWSGDYDSFYITRNGRRYRVQIIAGTHGTGPHLHVGVALA